MIFWPGSSTGTKTDTVAYAWSVTPRFKKVLAKKDKRMQDAVRACILQLAENPRHPGLQAHRMQGHSGVWECYVDAGNRVTFHYEDNTIVLRNNCNHDVLNRP